MSKEKFSTEETEIERQERQARRAEEKKRFNDTKEEYEKEERKELERFRQIVEIAKEIGDGWSEGHLAQNYIRFDELPNALAFQSLCNERGFNVKIIEPDPRDKLCNYFRVILE